jgi:osmotically-inducible protein OsmY
VLDDTTGMLVISLQTHRGTACLSGEVESEAQRDCAVSLALSAPGE